MLSSSSHAFSSQKKKKKKKVRDQAKDQAKRALRAERPSRGSFISISPSIQPSKARPVLVFNNQAGAALGSLMATGIIPDPARTTGEQKWCSTSVSLA